MLITATTPHLERSEIIHKSVTSFANQIGPWSKQQIEDLGHNPLVSLSEEVTALAMRTCYEFEKMLGFHLLEAERISATNCFENLISYKILKVKERDGEFFRREVIDRQVAVWVEKLSALILVASERTQEEWQKLSQLEKKNWQTGLLFELPVLDDVAECADLRSPEQWS